MGTLASQIISLTIVYLTVYSGADQRKTSKLRATGLCEGNSPVTNTPQKGSVTRKIIQVDDVIVSRHFRERKYWCSGSNIHDVVLLLLLLLLFVVVVVVVDVDVVAVGVVVIAIVIIVVIFIVIIIIIVVVIIMIIIIIIIIVVIIIIFIVIIIIYGRIDCKLASVLAMVWI